MADDVIEAALKEADGCETWEEAQRVFVSTLFTANRVVKLGWQEIKEAPFVTGFQAWLWADEWPEPKLGALLEDNHWYEKHTQKMIRPTHFYILPASPIDVLKEDLIQEEISHE